MLESPEERLDCDLARRLRFDTLITAEQQQQAKARLLLVAAAHTPLPPLTAAEPVSLRQRLHTARHYAVRLLELLLTDTSVYERARRPRPYYNIYGRYAFGVIYMSA